jgi:D-hexose-6-phosphate mutarotase
MPQTVSDLRTFELPGLATFAEQPGGLVALDVTTGYGQARLFLQGAHLATWQPVGHAPVLFLSDSSHFTRGKPIRGGVPVIFPWFGARAGDPGAPPHGFVRSAAWLVEAIDIAPDQTITVVLRIADSETSRASWPHPFGLRYRVTIGATLQLELEVENCGAAPFTFEAALHTYLATSDVRHVLVTGLGETEFIDKVDGFTRKRQDSKPLTFAGETDRIFLDTEAACVVDDPGLHRRITIEKTGSASTVVWNPWQDKARALADFGDDEWPQMLCIETANAADNAITLGASAAHTMTVHLSLA